MDTKNSVKYYTRAHLTVHFPEGNVRCTLCPLLETYSRKQCRLTGEYLAEGYLIGGMCPLDFEREANNGNSGIDNG